MRVKPTSRLSWMRPMHSCWPAKRFSISLSSSSETAKQKGGLPSAVDRELKALCSQHLSSGSVWCSFLRFVRCLDGQLCEEITCHVFASSSHKTSLAVKNIPSVVVSSTYLDCKGSRGLCKGLCSCLVRDSMLYQTVEFDMFDANIALRQYRCCWTSTSCSSILNQRSRVCVAC